MSEVVPAKKKLFVRTRADFEIYGNAIEPLGPEQIMKYLGQKFSPFGVRRCRVGALNRQLVDVRRAPLKPQQKMCTLKNYLIPRYIAHLQNFTITKLVLRRTDRLFRYAVRKILHINEHCNNAVIHAPKKSGGLGVFCFTQNIPIIMTKRWNGLRGVNSVLDEVLDLSQYWMDRIAALVSPGMDTKDLVALHNAVTLDTSFSGNGIMQVGANSACSFYIDTPPVYWSGGTT